MVAETHLSSNDLILPLFIHANEGRQEIGAMPGVYRYSISEAVEQIQLTADLGIPAVALFPVTPADLKTDDGREALNPNNLICTLLRAVKLLGLNIGLLCDVALDPYTSHGHDGVLDRDGNVDNDPTVEILCEQALNQVRAGCDMICPSDMMDGRVLQIRRRLEAEKFSNVMIMSYAAKYASAFYGPFREAIGSSALMGRDSQRGYRDKSNYQMDPRNTDEGLREAIFDINEGADFVMIKPGMPYLDIVYRVKQSLRVPTFVYQVSGEYSMIVDSASLGHLNRQQAIMESMAAFKRAGADGILTYFAIEVAEILATQ